MKKLSLYIFLVLMFCNVGFAKMIKFKNCNSNVPDSANIMGDKLPFWSAGFDTSKSFGGELRRYSDGFELRNVIVLTNRKDNIIYGYGLGHIYGIWEYEFNLKEPSFIVNELKSFPNDEQIKRIPKTDEFMRELQSMMKYEKKEPLTYKVTCTKDKE